jgi:glutathione S-transferase
MRAIADQWMEWSASRAFMPVIYLFFATVRTQPAERDPAKIASLNKEAHDALAILDRHLADRPYVCGDEFTMGDIPIGCVVYRYFNVEVERPALPHVEAWYDRLTTRPAYQDHVMRHFGTNPDEWAALEKACASEGVI